MGNLLSSSGEQGQNKGTPGNSAPPVQPYSPASQQAIQPLQTPPGCIYIPFTGQVPEDKPEALERSLKRRSQELEGSTEQSKRRSRPDLEASLGSPKRGFSQKRRSRPDLEESLERSLERSLELSTIPVSAGSS